MTSRWILALVGLGLTGCALGNEPYRFRSAYLAGATADVEPIAERPRPARVAGAHRGGGRPGASREDLPMPPEELTIPAPASGLVVSQLPAPHRAAAVTEDLPLYRTTAGDLRALTGTRRAEDPLAFAVRAAAALANGAPPSPVPDDGEALRDWMREHARGVDATTATAGDVLAFDRAVDGAPVSLWAVVLGRDDRGVVEMLYLAAGVVRRGFVDPAMPHAGRDGDRRVRNTFLRHGKDQPPRGTRYLAGELLAGAWRFR